MPMFPNTGSTIDITMTVNEFIFGTINSMLHPVIVIDE